MEAVSGFRGWARVLVLKIYLRFQSSWDYSRPYASTVRTITCFGEYGLMLSFVVLSYQVSILL